MQKIKFQSTYEQRAYIRTEFNQFAQDLATTKPTTTTRTWSFEIETPDADNVKRALETAYRLQTPQLIEIIGSREDGNNLYQFLNFCSDGSVERHDTESNECECLCESCTFHECNCENCNDQNDDPDHDCGNDDCYSATGDYQEIKPETYCEGTHPAHLQLLDIAGLADVEINNTCGLHIHLGSADLTTRDVANVIRVYRAMTPILDAIAERSNTYYAQHNTNSQALKVQFQSETTEKYYAVNTAPHFSGHRAQTIEFRQHAGTSDTAEVRAWAMLLIRIVEFAKTNQTTLWLQEAQTFEQAWNLLATK